MADASIVLKLVDQTSAGFSAAKRSGEALEKELASLSSKVDALKTRNEALNKNYAGLQTQLAAAKKAAREAANAYKESADETNKAKLDDANLKVKTLTDQLNDFRSASSDTRKEIRELQNEMRKLEGGGGGGGGGSGSSGGALSGAAAAAFGLAKQLGGAVTELGSFYLNSALGSTDAGVLTGILSGAASGAAVGALGGGVGVAIGAVVGAASGLISGLASQAESEDEAFRSHRDELISSVTELTGSALETGTASAATREQNQISFSALLGSGSAAAMLLDNIRELAKITPYVYDDLTGIAQNLAVYRSTGKDVFGNLQILGDAGSALNLDVSGIEGLASLLGKIGDTETYSSMFTRSLLNYKINPTEMLAMYYGVSEDEAAAMMSSGDLSGADASAAILSSLAKKYGGMMIEQSRTYTGALSTNEGLVQELQNVMGEAYNGVRKGGLEIMNTWYQDNPVMEEAYGVIGAAQADKANLQDALYRDVMNGIFGGQEAQLDLDQGTQDKIDELRTDYLAALEEYQTADEADRMTAGAKISSIYDQAEALAKEADTTNELMAEWDLAAIQTAEGVASIVATLDSYAEAWAYSKAMEKGRNGYKSGGGTAMEQDVTNILMSDADYYSYAQTMAASASRAMGQHVIPRDNFPILAHEGEMLLTASEARTYTDGVKIMISGNEFNVRSESDIDAIASALAARISRTAQNMG